MLMLAGSGESCADIEHLRSQGRLFGPVASDSTVYHTIPALDAPTLERLRDATAATRAQVWARTAATTSNAPVVWDIDASLVEIHSEHKTGTAPHFKGGFGFHPRNRPGVALFPVHVGPTLRFVKARPGLRVDRAEPRYWS